MSSFLAIQPIYNTGVTKCYRNVNRNAYRKRPTGLGCQVECVTLVCDKYEIHGVKTSPATLYTGYYGMSTRYRAVTMVCSSTTVDTTRRCV